MVKRLKFKRRFLNLTNYAKRKVFVESGKLRLVVRFSNRYILAQIIKAEIRGDNCLVSVHSSELKKLGWPFSLKNIPASYLVGYMIGKKALKKGIEEVALDIGLKMPTKGARVFAVAKGAIDAGLKLPINEEVIPDEKRIKGYHIIEYYNMIKNDESKKVFLSTYRSNESNIEKLPDIISGIINKINTDI